MEKQKICIIGGGLTGLITAITLSKLNLKIDLITGNINQYINLSFLILAIVFFILSLNLKIKEIIKRWKNKKFVLLEVA